MNVVNFIDPTAKIHPSSQVWHFAVVMADVFIDEKCSVGARAEIGRCTTMRRGCRIGSGAFLPPGTYLAERVFIGPNTTFTDDRYPKVGNMSYKAEPPFIESDVSIGAGCVILPGVRIGARSLIGAGSVVTEDVPPDSILRGLPSRELRPRG